MRRFRTRRSRIGCSRWSRGVACSRSRRLGRISRTSFLSFCLGRDFTDAGGSQAQPQARPPSLAFASLGQPHGRKGRKKVRLLLPPSAPSLIPFRSALSLRLFGEDVTPHAPKAKSRTGGTTREGDATPDTGAETEAVAVVEEGGAAVEATIEESLPAVVEPVVE